MKLTVQDVYNLMEGLGSLAEKELSTKTAFRIQRNQKKVMDEFEIADKLRKKLIEKYKEKDLDNGTVKLKEDKLHEFKKDYDELMEQEVDIKLSYIYLHELGDTIQPKVLGQLDTIIREDESNEAAN